MSIFPCFYAQSLLVNIQTPNADFDITSLIIDRHDLDRSYGDICCSFGNSKHRSYNDLPLGISYIFIKGQFGSIALTGS